MSLTANIAEFEELERDLKRFAEKAVPFANRSALNSAAFHAQSEMRQNIDDDMINRNAWTKRSVQVEIAKGLKVRNQMSVVGSVADYMDDQEFGGLSAKGGKFKTVIPTSWAANQDGAKPRTKLPTRARKLQNIQLKRRLRSKNMSRRQEAFVRAVVAANQGDKYVFIEGSRSGFDNAGIYRIWGRKKRKGKYKGVRMKMAYSFRRNPTSLSKIATLGPAVDETAKRMPEFYAEALLFQLKRNGILGY